MKKLVSVIIALIFLICMPIVAVAIESPSFDNDEDRVGLIKKAIEEYENEDHTPLEDPATYRLLWLGYTHVTFGELDFQMTDFDRDYLISVAQNFEVVVENYADHSVDIQVDLFFVDTVTSLTKVDDDDWLYLAQETVQSDIDRYRELQHYDTVLTTVQTEGDANYQRNRDKSGYDVNYVMLGLETAGISSGCGYSTFDLGEPITGTYPLENPEIPSLYATAVAVHEWMHQLEDLGWMLGIEYPNTHAYMGAPEFPGYQAYSADKNNYDFFEFYELVLMGELPYTDEDGNVKHVGMYPTMWRLIQSNTTTSGTYTIQTVDGNYLAGREKDQLLTISRDEYLWTITAIGDDRFILSPVDIPDWRIDLDNALDEEGNTVKLWYDTGYLDAQSWRLIMNEDGTFYIQTPYKSGRVITVRYEGAIATLNEIDNDAYEQKWIVSKIYTEG